MSNKGSRPKARSLKLLAGTLRPCRDRAQSVTREPSAAPVAPSWLPMHARAEFNRLAGLLAARGAVGESTEAMLGHYCAITDQLADIFKAGKMPTGAAMTAHRGLARVLGLDEVVAEAVPKRVNPFARFAFKGRGKT